MDDLRMNDLHVEDGAAFAWFAYDVGQQIDLDRAQKRCTVVWERELIRHQRSAPAYLQFQPAPLRLDEPGKAIAIGGFETDARIEVTLYDFGAVSIAYRIPIAGRGLADLQALANVLGENPQLLADSRQRVLAVIGRLADAVRTPRLADLVEDYVVFHVRRWSPDSDPGRIVQENRSLIARILRSEPEELSATEVAETLQFQIAYGLQDELAIDWNGAFLFDAQGEDTLAVLEFANVELLEMRFLDDRLDLALDRSLDVLRARRGPRSIWPSGQREARENLSRIAALEIENAILFESVNNAIKLLGDQFLARVYRLAARRFHLDDWDASILRKLQTLESIHSKLSNEQATRRMEVLEWIIILLFVLSIAIPFVIGGGH